MQSSIPRELSPSLSYDERDGKVVRLQVTHSGRVGRILARFPSAIVRQAVDQMEWWQSKREYQLLKAARRLDPVARRVVREHLLLPRCQKIASALQRKARRQFTPRRSLSLTEAWGRLHGHSPAQPMPSQDRERGR